MRRAQVVTVMLCVMGSPLTAGGRLRPVTAFDNWVPFSASYTIKEASKPDQVATGKFWRARDGSTRNDLAPPEKPSVVSISNVTEQSAYYLMPDGKWYRLPFSSLPGLAIRKPSAPREDAIVGTGLHDKLKVIQVRAGGGFLWLAEPLDYFAVRRTMGGRTEEYTDISIGEQASSLFVPPADSKAMTITLEEFKKLWAGGGVEFGLGRF